MDAMMTESCQSQALFEFDNLKWPCQPKKWSVLAEREMMKFDNWLVKLAELPASTDRTVIPPVR
jgi:hypothetical protein